MIDMDDKPVVRLEGQRQAVETRIESRNCISGFADSTKKHESFPTMAKRVDIEYHLFVESCLTKLPMVRRRQWLRQTADGRTAVEPFFKNLEAAKATFNLEFALARAAAASDDERRSSGGDQDHGKSLEATSI